MADERKIVIELKSTTDAVESKKDTGTNLESDGSYNLSTAMNKALSSVNTNTAGWMGIATYAFKSAANAVMQVATYDISKFFNLRDDYIAEMRFNNVKTAVEKVKGLTGAISAGVGIGAAAGPAGMMAGAAIGMASWIVTELISSYQRAETQRIALDTAKYQSAFQLTRLGLIDGGRGTEN